jgi:drug/metabolite transporter (DMT)-like permease
MFNQTDLSFIYKYFSGEKQESLLFIILGIAGVICSVVFFFFVKSAPLFFKGMAVPALAIGLVLGIVGFTVYKRSDKQAKDISYNMGLDAANYITQTEQPRMEKVMKNFAIYRWIEIGLIVLGVFLFFYYKTSNTKQFVKGIGLSLAIMAVLALTADFFAEKRGRLYVEHLQNLLPK